MLPCRRCRPGALVIPTDCRAQASKAPSSTQPQQAALTCRWAPDKATAQAEPKELKELSPAPISVMASPPAAMATAAATAEAAFLPEALGRKPSRKVPGQK